MQSVATRAVPSDRASAHRPRMIPTAPAWGALGAGLQALYLILLACALVFVEVMVSGAIVQLMQTQISCILRINTGINNTRPACRQGKPKITECGQVPKSRALNPRNCIATLVHNTTRGTRDIAYA
jgi:hypothetical protein